MHRLYGGTTIEDGNYLPYYDLERYILEDVWKRFHKQGCLDAFDFFSIIIWKSNRAKSKTAKRLVRLGASKKVSKVTTLDEVAIDITMALTAAPDLKARLRVLLEEWEFHLPIASAILSMLWPDDFTVYDVRVRTELHLKEINETGKDFDKIWHEYREYVDRVIEGAPQGYSLRDCDRYLWARSAARGLEKDIALWEAQAASGTSER